ncbi:hypothetical protein BC826DRAFT_620666 [Russula brevipes]|nr:hypothetical protein BC826DRAFT_620666 [Russula brevipes]
MQLITSLEADGPPRGSVCLSSAVAQADGARANGAPVRREPIDTVHLMMRFTCMLEERLRQPRTTICISILCAWLNGSVPQTRWDARIFSQIGGNRDFLV